MAIQLDGIETVSGGVKKLPATGVAKKMKYVDNKRTDIFLGTAVTVAMPRKGYATTTILVKGKDISIEQEELDAACMNDAPIMAEFKGVTVEITNDFRTGKIIVKGTASDVIFHRDGGDFFPDDNDSDIMMSPKK